MIRPADLAARLRLGLAMAVVVAIADQASKGAILDAFRPEGVTETPFHSVSSLHPLPILDLVLVWNYGVSFSLGNTPGPFRAVIFTALAAAIAAVLIGWLLKTRTALPRLAIGLVLGGALGNVIDRLRFGAVVDFLYVHIGAFDWWPVFNLADSAICVGAGLMVLESLFAKRDSHMNRP